MDAPVNLPKDHSVNNPAHKLPGKETSGSDNGDGIVDSVARRGAAGDGLDTAVHKRALRKLDLLLLPSVTFIYFLNFLDRSNIGNARPAGLQADLGLSNQQYSIVLTVTYVPYIVAELPLTLAMKWIGPNIMIPTLVVAWGIVTTFQGFVTNYEGLLATRFFLGLTEGAILPSSIAYLSTFYCRADLGKRVAIFFSATSLAGAFSGLLAAALLNMEGLGGKRGWAWIFIIEGLLTVVFGVLSFFILPRGPKTARYLTAEEKESIALAHEADRQLQGVGESEGFSWGAVLSALKSPQMWFMFIQFFSSGVMLYALAFFTPTIVQAIGYRGTAIQLYSVPPYVCSAFVAILACWTSDHYRHRGAFIILASVIAVAGYAIYFTSTTPNVLYASLFLMIIGAYTVAPLQSTWMPNNLDPYYKRATGIAMGFVSTNSGGILSTWMFPTTESPRFRRGTGILLGLSSAMALFAALNSAYLYSANKRKARVLAERGATGADGKLVRGEHDGVGDASPHFKYIT